MRSSDSSHQALRILLLVIAIIQALAGVALLFGSVWFSLLPTMPHLFSPDFASLMLKLFAALAIFAAILSYAASRDPVRNVAIIDAFIFLLIAVVAIDIYGSWVLHLSPVFAGPWALIRIVAVSYTHLTLPTICSV